MNLADLKKLCDEATPGPWAPGHDREHDPESADGQAVWSRRMKLFAEMSPVDKIDHIERCLANSLPEVKDVTCLADILDVWDLWAPYMIGRLRKLERVAEAAKRLDVCLDDFGVGIESIEAALEAEGGLVDALAALEADA